ncbi:NAD(P)-dependent oxidoreductase [Pseudorhizobium endolithicum]|uniref:UDP-glucose 4-epimerase n=1 Tax=Pseudorhizobium endolithicum TaxID=1191678 RepID=A0ABM8PPT0_9HYPH|nr:NAD(P)-dependent oxidoreductase [Pseudorhizobium endolithicum]CAD7041432.1 NAD(P)-dependent oxidoreductase [Pseudorhizobium endolithicum]
MKVLVSGGSGLVGRYIVNGLLQAGYDVAVGGRTPAPRDWFVKSADFVPLVLDPDEDQHLAFKGMDAFVHAAFDHLPGKYRGGEGEDPDRFRRLNLDGTVRLFETAKAAGVGRTVFLSSRAVYDGLSEGEALDETAVLSPTFLYGHVKFEAEKALQSLSGHDFVITSLRLTGVYGNLRPNKWDDLFADYLAGRPIVSRAGTEVHGSDVASAVRLMLEADIGDINGRAFNVSDIIVNTVDLLPHVPTRLDPAGQTVKPMNTGRISTLGWTSGGYPLLERTLCELYRAYRIDGHPGLRALAAPKNRK